MQTRFHNLKIWKNFVCNLKFILYFIFYNLLNVNLKFYLKINNEINV